MVWSCPFGLEGLLAVGVDLVHVNAVKVLAKNVQGSAVVANQDLESANLIVVVRTVVAIRNVVEKKTELKFVEIRTW